MLFFFIRNKMAIFGSYLHTPQGVHTKPPPALEFRGDRPFFAPEIPWGQTLLCSGMDARPYQLCKYISAISP